MSEAEESERWAGDPFLPHNPPHHRDIDTLHHVVHRDNIISDTDRSFNVHHDVLAGGFHHDHHTPKPLSGAEAYHRFLWHNKHVLYELKLSVIIILGSIIVLACVVYIVLQCRARLRPSGGSGRGHSHNQARNRRDDEKELFGSTETLENLIPVENSIRLSKVRRDQEFFV